MLAQRHGKEPTQDEIAAAYAGWKPYEGADKACAAAAAFKSWYKLNKTEARRLAGMASVAKRKESKLAGIKPKRRAKKTTTKKTERKSLDAF